MTPAEQQVSMNNHDRVSDRVCGVFTRCRLLIIGLSKRQQKNNSIKGGNFVSSLLVTSFLEKISLKIA